VCKSLREIIFEPGSTLKGIGVGAFWQSLIESIRVPNSVEKIGMYWFDVSELCCGIEFELDEIDDWDLVDCSFTCDLLESDQNSADECFFSGLDAEMENISQIHNSELIVAFEVGSCSILEVVFESSFKLNGIDSSHFYGLGLRSVVVPFNVEKICFSGCESLCKVTFEPNSKLKEIGEYCFDDCQVKTIEIPEECELINGLSLCGLESVTIAKGNKHLKLMRNGCLIDDGKKSLIRFFGVSNSIHIENVFESIAKGCFYKCKTLCEIRFKSGSKLKEFVSHVFQFSGLRSIQIPSSVQIIGDHCFDGCESLCEIRFESESKLREIGVRAFCASGLESIEIPKGVEKIGNGCFLLCSFLRETTLEPGSKLKEIDKSAFSESCGIPRKSKSNVEDEFGWRCFDEWESLFES
jgi:hypothetical protein